jgi:2-phospho-L-lactate transferase/gluconeogenesis factor (CofD/UPF0052 family)
MDKVGVKIVVIGGGTGSFTLLSQLKNYTTNITAIVNMADDGGSTGVLRDELGVLPPGDVRQCLVALSESEKGVGEALANTNATVVYVSNLVTKHGQTDGFTVADHAAEIERFAGHEVLDYVLYNTAHPSDILAEKYEAEKAFIVEAGDVNTAHYKVVTGNYLGSMAEAEKSDKLPVTRSLIRHDADAIAKELMRLYFAKTED